MARRVQTDFLNQPEEGLALGHRGTVGLYLLGERRTQRRGRGEDRLIADGPRSQTWNDLRDASSPGSNHVDIFAYVVEYGKVEISTSPKRVRK